MIKHRLFVKGEKVYALLSSHSYPNILIPVKAIVKDVKHDDINPQYLIKIIKFYDNIRFIRKYLLNMSFSNNFNKRARNIKIRKDISKDELIELFNNKNEERRYYIVVDSIMVKKLRGELAKLFNRVTDHLIEKRFKENREYMTRTFYSGKYRLTGSAEYNARLKKFIGDKVLESGMKLDEYFRLL